MWQVRGPWFGFWSLFGTILGPLESFRFLWNVNFKVLVHEVGWFGILETHEAWILLYGPINTKEAWNRFCMPLVRGILTKSHF